MTTMNSNTGASPIRVLCCSRLDRMGASSRYRTYQFFPYLQQHGFEIEQLPLLDSKYLQLRYTAGRRSTFHVVPGYLRRWLRFRRRTYDLLWVEKESFPWIPWWIEALSLPKGIPYVADYDDAEFHRYDRNEHTVLRLLLSGKIEKVMQRAAMVVAGNPYIAKRARRAGAANVEWLPTVVDLDRYPVVPPPRNKVFTIGWIGTPITARFLQIVAPALREISRNGDAKLVTIGSGPVSLPGVSLEVLPWSEDTEVQNIQQFDVGIMPLSNTPGNRGKCGLKLIQYMACGRPIVGTPIGVNSEIIQHGINGFQATTVEEWVEALKNLRADSTLREQMGCVGRRIVEKRYSLNVAAPRLAALLRTAAATSQTR